jgi:hypothetical protein
VGVCYGTCSSTARNEGGLPTHLLPTRTRIAALSVCLSVSLLPPILLTLELKGNMASGIAVDPAPKGIMLCAMGS